MRIFAVATLIALGGISSIASAAACEEPKLESVPSTHPECYFYKGTRHFRAKEYSAALEAWLAVVNQKNLPKELEYLRVDAQNNLGFLYYMGWGVKQNSALAIERFWQPAEKAGHDEAAYHLCHSYVDEGSKLALGYCREALRRYTKGGRTDSDDSEVVAQIRKYLSRLEAR